MSWLSVFSSSRPSRSLVIIACTLVICCVLVSKPNVNRSIMFIDASLTWSRKFQGNAAVPDEKLKITPQKIYDNFTKVILMAQARGGSTFLSSLFFQNSAACFWFEPEFSIYKTIYGMVPIGAGHPDEIQFTTDGVLRKPTTYELVWMTHYLVAILNNDIRNLPKTIWYDDFTLRITLDRRIKPLFDCVARKSDSKFTNAEFCEGVPELYKIIDCYRWNGSTKGHGKTLNFANADCADGHRLLECGSQRFRQFVKDKNKCDVVVGRLSNQCKQRPISAVKLHRLRMAYVKPILLADPAVKIIHYVRDPRGILSSRKKIKSRDMRPPTWSGRSWIKYAAGLCSRLLDDARVVRELRRNYPDNILTMRYEDLAVEPQKYARKLYDFIGQELPQTVSNWFKSATKNSNRTKEHAYMTERKDSAKTAYAWRKYWSKNEVKDMSGVCRNALDELGYPQD